MAKKDLSSIVKEKFKKFHIELKEAGYKCEVIEEGRTISARYKKSEEYLISLKDTIFGSQGMFIEVYGRCGLSFKDDAEYSKNKVLNAINEANMNVLFAKMFMYKSVADEELNILEKDCICFTTGFFANEKTNLADNYRSCENELKRIVKIFRKEMKKGEKLP